MAVATTRPELIRNQWVTLIEALTPTRHSAVPFHAATSAIGLERWAEENPQACLRRFDVTDATDREDPSLAVSNKDLELALWTAELMIVYPHTLGLYGDENMRDLQDLQRADADQVRKAIGINGGANYVSGEIRCEARYRFDTGEAISMTIFDIETEYYFDISSV